MKNETSVVVTDTGLSLQDILYYKSQKNCQSLQ